MKRDGPYIWWAAALGVGALLASMAATTLSMLAVFAPPVPRVPLSSTAADAMAAAANGALLGSSVFLLVALVLVGMLLTRHTFPHWRLRLRPTGAWLPKVAILLSIAVTIYWGYSMYLAIAAYRLARATQPDLASVTGIAMNLAILAFLWIPPAFVCLAQWWSPRAYPGHCGTCSYDRTGLTSGSACPECGAVPTGLGSV